MIFGRETKVHLPAALSADGRHHRDVPVERKHPWSDLAFQYLVTAFWVSQGHSRGSGSLTSEAQSWNTVCSGHQHLQGQLCNMYLSSHLDEFVNSQFPVLDSFSLEAYSDSLSHPFISKFTSAFTFTLCFESWTSPKTQYFFMAQF